MRVILLALAATFPVLAVAIPEPATSTTLSFPDASLRLSRSHRSTLRHLARKVRSSDRIEVVGLPDRAERGAERRARRRAEKAAEFLRGQGIAPERLRVRVLSGARTRPLPSEASPSPEDRGVEVHVLPSNESGLGVFF